MEGNRKLTLHLLSCSYIMSLDTHSPVLSCGNWRCITLILHNAGKNWKHEWLWRVLRCNKKGRIDTIKLTGRSQPLLQPPHTSWVFWCAGSGETADLPWPSCTDFSDVHSHDWLWNLALRRKAAKGINTILQPCRIIQPNTTQIRGQTRKCWPYPCMRIHNIGMKLLNVN